MRGLDPRIHLLREKFLRRSMDCRVKPGNDDLNLAPMGLDPRIHQKDFLFSGWIAGSQPGNDSGVIPRRGNGFRDPSIPGSLRCAEAL
jgi:hypothetical protein